MRFAQSRYKRFHASTRATATAATRTAATMLLRPHTHGRSELEPGLPMNVWLMDVDGVLNALARYPAQGHRRFVANGFDITYDPAITERVLALHRSGLVEVRWLTTWEETANLHLIAKFGWPELGLAGERVPRLRERGWWKAPLAQSVYDAGHRVVWTDDDLAYCARQAQVDWALAADPDRLLAISPDSLTGLTEPILDEIEAWLRQEE